MNIAYAGNAKVFKGVLLSVLSILKHTNKPINIYVLTMDLQDIDKSYSPINSEMIGLLEKIVKEKNEQSTVVAYDVSQYYLDTIATSKNKNTIYTPYCFLRLYLSKLDGIADKVIYLDVDTMVYNDLQELFDIDVEGYEYGAVLDHMGKFWINKYYLNSGVLLLNMPLIRETGLFENCVDMLLHKKLMLPDQTALNDLVRKKLFLDRKFNEQRKVRPDTVVKHFCQGFQYFPIPKLYNIKQWDIKKVQKKLKIREFDDIFEIYLKLVEEYPICK